MSWKYIAGFFDGEGTLTKAEKRYRIYITQTNKEVLDMICRFARVGNIKPIKKRRSHWHDAWIYYITDKHKIKKFLIAVYPYLIVKRKVTSRAIKEIDNKIASDNERRSLKKSRVKMIADMRHKGLSYRAIGKEMNIDWGYARKIFKGLK